MRKIRKDSTEHEQHIFTSNLKRSILLDSEPIGRVHLMRHLVHSKLAILELEKLDYYLDFFPETIHSRSYTPYY